MTIEDLLKICKQLKGTTTDIKWEDHLCFNVGEKIYLLTSPDQIPPTASFKVTEEDFETLTERDGISQARYFARSQWVSLDNIGVLGKEEWEMYITRSYRLVASKLSKKIRTELGIE